MLMPCIATFGVVLSVAYAKSIVDLLNDMS